MRHYRTTNAMKWENWFFAALCLSIRTCVHDCPPPLPPQVSPGRSLNLSFSVNSLYYSFGSPWEVLLAAGMERRKKISDRIRIGPPDELNSLRCSLLPLHHPLLVLLNVVVLFIFISPFCLLFFNGPIRVSIYTHHQLNSLVAVPREREKSSETFRHSAPLYYIYIHIFILLLLCIIVIYIVDGEHEDNCRRRTEKRVTTHVPQ